MSSQYVINYTTLAEYRRIIPELYQCYVSCVLSIEDSLRASLPFSSCKLHSVEECKTKPDGVNAVRRRTMTFAY